MCLPPGIALGLPNSCHQPIHSGYAAITGVFIVGEVVRKNPRCTDVIKILTNAAITGVCVVAEVVKKQIQRALM